jgi:DNA sulfur modification protein DndD
MRLNLLGWKCEGLRCPDFNFELNQKGKALATFLQMPNGTGKTTTLRLLKRSLYNHEFKSSEIKQYKAKKENEIKKNGFFQAKFEVEGKIFYSQINFDFEKLEYNYTSSLADKGFDSFFQLPKEIENIVDKELIDLLFVDLELDVKPMFRSHQTGAQEAISKFCKINVLNRVINDFETYKNKKRKENVASGSVQNQINTEEAREKRINNKINEVEAKVKEFKKYLNQTEDEYNDGKKRLQEIFESDDQIKSKRKELVSRRDDAKSNYEEILAKNFEAIKNIGSYENSSKEELNYFVNALDDLGLPEEEVRVFFDKILKREKCICGHDLNDENKEIIKKEMKSFISENEARTVARIKATFSDNLKINTANLAENSNKIQDYKFELDGLNEKINLLKETALKDNIELDRKITDLEKERSIRKTFLNDIINQPWQAKDNETSTESLVSLKEQKKIVEKKLADLSGTKELEEKVSVIIKSLEAAITASENEISSEITKECNKKIDVMFTKNPIYINSIKNNIVLEGQDEGSTGQEARIGIIFLLTLLERSKIKFPLIVDTPVKGMDSAAKRRTARFISRLESQFVCFVIDEDKPNFTDKFNEIMDGKGNFITAFRRSDEFDKLVESNISNVSVTESYNGKVVHGYPFFEIFTEEDEEDE